MAGLPAIPETTAAAAARCGILLAVANLWPTHERFAAAMGVSKGTVSRWLSGDLVFGWPVLFSAVSHAAALHPAAMPAIFKLLASEVGAPVKVLPTVELVGGDLLTEIGDEAKADAAVHSALLDLDLDRFDSAIDQKHTEAEQLRTAGRAHITAQLAATKGLRVAGGGR
jgi:hypothetical protein